MARISRRELLRPSSDAAVLSHLLEVEHVVVFSYEHVLSGGLLATGAAAALSPFLGHEREHVSQLAGELSRRGGSPPKPPLGVQQADRLLSELHVTAQLSRLRLEREAVQLLIGAESAAIGAYYAAISKLRDPALVVRAAQAMAGEAQHAVVLRRILHPRRVSKYVSGPFVEGLR